MKKFGLLLGALILCIYTYCTVALCESCSTCSTCHVESKSSIKTCVPSCLESQAPIFHPCGLTGFSSQTFLFPRPIYDNLAAKQALWHSIIYDKTGSLEGS